MNINWLVRLKSKQFWIGLVGVLAAFVVGVASLFGVTIDAGPWTDALTTLIQAVFAVLGLVGVVTDPTTKGISDSAQAMGYSEPRDAQ